MLNRLRRYKLFRIRLNSLIKQLKILRPLMNISKN